jgi:hypothetical protein
MQQRTCDGPPWETVAAAPATEFRPGFSAVPEAAETAAAAAVAVGVAGLLSYPGRRWRAQPA